MRVLALAVLTAVLPGCRKPAPPPPAPTPQALGKELATFPQMLVPLTAQSVIDYQDALARKGADNVTITSFRQTYILREATVENKKVKLFVGYAGTWQAPKGSPLQPMAIQQFLRAFAADPEAEVAMVAAPKGTFFFTRVQLPDVIGAARDAGARSEDLPFSLVLGNGR